MKKFEKLKLEIFPKPKRFPKVDLIIRTLLNTPKLATSTSKGTEPMIRRFLGIFVDHKLSRVTRVVHRGDVEDSGAFTVPSLAVAFAPAASPLIVHLSCFTPLKQQSPVDRAPGLPPPRAFLSSRVFLPRGSPRGKIADLFIYLSRMPTTGLRPENARKPPLVHSATVFTLCREDGRGSFLSREESSRVPFHRSASKVAK